MLLADGGKMSSAPKAIHYPQQQLASVFTPEMSSQARYNGHPLISYANHKKKKKNNQRRQNQSGKNISHHHNNINNNNLWEDYYRCMEYVGEPLMLIPRGGTNRGVSGPAQFYHPLHHHPAYAAAAYHQMINAYPAEYYHGIPGSQIHPNHQHRDSFSSSCSSSDTASSGSASPVHFPCWDNISSNNAFPTADKHITNPKREWIHKTLQDVPEVSLGVSLRVMTYNILAEQYASKKLHSYCPKWALAWTYRKERIREDIEQHAPDVACLQEVTMGEFYQYFLDNLRTQGYNGIFSPKSRANTMQTKDRQVVDGCAVIFRSDRFELIHQHLVEFNQLAIKNAGGSNEMINRVMTKDNIALCAVLRVIDACTTPASSTYVLVVNVHIHWDPECCDVKLIQTMLLMCEVEKLVHNMKQELNVTDIPLIFCGDLNSLPNSGVVEFLENGRVSVDHADFKELPYRSCLQKLNNQPHLTPEGHFFHPFVLSSVYDDDDMPFTNFTPEFKGVIDYIFVSKEKFHRLAVLGPIETNWMEEQKPLGFPCQQVPSDHLPLLVDIELVI